MNIFRDFHHKVEAALHALAGDGKLPAGLELAGFVVEPPRDAAHGDLSTNAAMALAKKAGMKPRDLAELLAAQLIEADRATGEFAIAGAEIAGPGFINLRLNAAVWQAVVQSVLEAGAAFGASDMGQGKKVNIEYVSANPTGPLHVAHARGAVFGDALAALLERAGFDVTREYYINDAGGQIEILARSAILRMREALGETIGDIPEGLYPGEYLKPVGRALADQHGKALFDKPDAEQMDIVKRFAVDAMMEGVREDLAALNIRHNVFFSERQLQESGRVGEMVAELLARDLVYTGVLEKPKGAQIEDWEPRPQLLFRSTAYGDDVDRPLQKSDGNWTYFAADIAYHYDKYRRGFLQMIDVLGADHGGYVKRMKAAVSAASNGKASLDVKLCQLVRVMRNGEPVRMSKRAGNFITVRDVLDEVGRDVTRFIMLTRTNDAPLDFDYAKVTEQSKDNPVFYVQYAHARIHSVLRKSEDQFGVFDADNADLGLLTHEAELGLIRTLAAWPRLVETAAEAHEPHRVAFYLQELAAQLHGFYNRGNDEAGLRVIMADNRELTQARLALISAVALVIAAGLGIIGVVPVKEM